jgi:hypothetical protein
MCFGLGACDSDFAQSKVKQPGTPPAATIAEGDWQTVTSLRVVFGHQSVGANILSGIEAMARDRKPPLVIEESSAPFTGAGIRHFLVGTNGDPTGKVAAFATALRGGLGASADVAVLKLCFTDFDDIADAQGLADQYIETLKNLAAEFPQTRFVPVTAPLTTLQSGPKAWIKKLIGRDPAGYAENARRAEFNGRLRRNYGSTGLLFDLASLESADGRFGIEYHGHRIETLNEDWTDDGSHLNESGQAVVANAFIKHLADIEHQ